MANKKKLEVWELPDDPKANDLPSCRICGLATSNTDQYGRPLCEFCKDDYKKAHINQFKPKPKDYDEDEDEE